MRKSIILLSFLLLIALLPAGQIFATGNIVTIMHTNDMHGRMEPDRGTYALARLKAIKDTMNPDIMVDGGDAFQGLPISNASKGSDMAEILNEIGYQGMAVGNHEFDFGKDIALGYKDLLNFPILSSNTINTTDNSHLFEPSYLYNDGTYDIAIIGVTTPETTYKTHPNNTTDIDFIEPIDAVKTEIARYPNADLYVIAAHLGNDLETIKEWTSTGLAKALASDPEYTEKKFVIADGHSHSEYPEGIMKWDNVIIGQTGTALKNVGYIEVDMDDFKNTTAELIPLDDKIIPDPQVVAMIDSAYESFEQTVSNVIFENNTILLNGERKFARSEETNLGNLIGDALVDYGQTGLSNKTDFAVINGGGVRASIQPGNITQKDIITVLPFGNVLTQIEVLGEDVWDMFEFSLDAGVVTEAWNSSQAETDQLPLLDGNGYPHLTPKGALLQVSDTIRVYYDTNLASGSRISGIDIYDRDKDTYVPIDLDKTYYMVTNDFLAVGGDGYGMLGGAREEGPSLDTVVSEYIQSDAIDWNKYDTTSPYRLISLDAKSYTVKDLDTQPVLDKITQYSKELESGKYTTDSMVSLKVHIEGIQKRLADKDYTQESLDQFLLDLNNGYSQLKLKDTTTPVTPTPEGENKPDKPTTTDSSKNTDTLPSTGIGMDSTPYLLVAAGALLSIVRRNES